MASLMEVFELGGPKVEDEGERRSGAVDWSEDDGVAMVAVQGVRLRKR